MLVQLYSLMWILGIFFGLLGFMRGWNRDLVATAGIIVAMFVLFQFDFFIRGVILSAFTRGQAFFIQVGIFLTVVYYAYQNTAFGVDSRGGRQNIQSGILGAIVGFFNGYLVGGTLWYFIDINEYPFDPFIIAPLPGSPSAELINTIPLVVMSGGASGSGEFLIVVVVIILVIVLVAL